MLKGHLDEMNKAQRAIARAAKIYAKQGHDELYQKTIELWAHSRLATETIFLAVQAEAAS